MPTLVVGMLENTGKTRHAHDKRGHGTPLVVTRFVGSKPAWTA
jgi:hypothetical protein